MSKRILIYMQASELKPTGGPIGYINNLKQELDKKGNTDIYFIESGREVINKYKNKIESMKNGRMKSFLIILKRIIKFCLLFYTHNHRSLVDLNQYDAVHFHSPYDMFNVRDSLKEYKGKVILTSHSPQVSSKEICDTFSAFERKYCGFISNKMIRIDEYAFARADYYVFPCPEAEEPYYNSWSEYATLKEKNANKYRYLLTGIKQCVAKEERGAIREHYKIPKDAFVVSYVGRHNRIKGYDYLLQIGERLLEKENVYFLVAGIQEPLRGLNHSRWIEAGWTNDPHSLIAAADVFILPNRETYFDLVMLEALSLGQIIVASRTGGNKFFSKEQSHGIFLYDNLDEAERIILLLKEKSKEKIEALKSENKKLYETLFTSEIFASGYLQLIEELVNQKKLGQLRK